MISAIIPCHNEEKYIGECVRNIFSHCMDDFIGEVIVVNNASTDRTTEILKEMQSTYGPRLIIVNEPTPGVSFARRSALQHATGEYVASIDADCRPDERWCYKAKELLRLHPDAVAISGPYVFYDATPLLRFLMNIRARITKVQLLFERHERRIMYGGNFIAKRSMLEEAGGFNTGIEFFGEDIDVELRMRKLGRVIHDTTFTMPSSARRFMHEGILKTWFIYKITRIYQLATKKPLPFKNRNWR